jgi:hypothetical protein
MPDQEEIVKALNPETLALELRKEAQGFGSCANPLQIDPEEQRTLQLHQRQAADLITAQAQELARVEEERDEARERMSVAITVGAGLSVYGSMKAIDRVQDYILLDSSHPVEKEDVRRSLARDLQSAEALLAECTRELAEERERREVWDWLSERINLELSFGTDDEEELGEWRVHSVNGGYNDREWTLIGTGVTPTDALRQALASTTQNTGGEGNG